MIGRILDHDQVRVISDVTALRDAVAAKQPVWIELERHSPEADALLTEVVGVHPLTLEDVWATRTAPKLEDYEAYLYMIVHGVRGETPGKLELIELDVIIGPTFVVTHDPSGLIAGDVAADLARSPRLLARGPAWLAHAILDHAVDRYLPVIDHLDDQLDSLEDDVLRRAGTPSGPPVLRRILRFKRLIQELRRMSIHQRELLLRLARGEFDEIPAEAVPFYRDVHDHFVRINDLVESYRDVVAGALEAYLSVQSNRMNEVMKTLTLIATVMLPVTFIAGVYGMNFDEMPELHHRWGYPFVLGLMALVTVACFAWFRHKGWIGNGVPDLPNGRDGDGPDDDDPPPASRRGGSGTERPDA